MSPTVHRQVKATATGKAAKTVTWKGKEHRADALASRWLVRLEATFAESQSTRARNAVYAYLTAIYEFVAGFETSVDCRTVVKRMAGRKGLVIRCDEDTRFILLIRATATVNEKTRWKWSKCLAHAWSQD